MPPAARVADPTSHGPPLNPGPGSPDVLIGYMPAWRALPTSVGPALDAISNAMDSFMKTPMTNPGSAASDLVQIGQKLVEGGVKAASAGPQGASAPGVAAGQLATLISTNVALTATWTAASVVPGGQPAADQAYTLGIKAAAAVAASSVVSAMGGLADMHICPIPCPVPPHGPGMVTQGSKTVVINNLPACRQNDKVMEACGGADPIAMGCSTVLIGDDEGSAGSPESPSAAQAAQDAQTAQQAQAASSAAALTQAAAAGTPLVEICPQCAKLQASARRTKHTLMIRVVIDETGEPVPGIALSLTLPDGQQEPHTTDPDGRIEIDDLDASGTCSATCDLASARLQETYGFVGTGPARLTPASPGGPAAPPRHPHTGGVIAQVEEHKVKTGESIDSLARANGLTWQKLALFNWNTSVPREINQHLRDFVGCTKKTPDGQNYMFDSSDDPGIVYIPKKWTQAGLATDVENTIRVRLTPTPQRRLIITLVDAEDHPRPDVPYQLVVGAATFNARTNAQGRIDHLVPTDQERGRLGVDGQEIELLLDQLESIETLVGVQKRLNNLGYDCGRPTGYLNERTIAAVREFQGVHGLPVNGQVAAAMRTKLREVYGQ